MEIRNRNGLSRELIWEYALLILIFLLNSKKLWLERGFFAMIIFISMFLIV